MRSERVKIFGFSTMCSQLISKRFLLLPTTVVAMTARAKQTCSRLRFGGEHDDDDDD